MRIVQSIVESRAEGLLRTLFDSVENVGKEDPNRSMMDAPLHHRISKAGAACADVPIGKRECHVGSMLVLAQILALNSTGFQSEMTSTTAEAPLVWPMLRDILEGDDAWNKFVAAGGPLSTLVKEQEGELCPPRARYYDPSESVMDSTGSAVYDDWNETSSI